MEMGVVFVRSGSCNNQVQSYGSERPRAWRWARANRWCCSLLSMPYLLVVTGAHMWKVVSASAC